MLAYLNGRFIPAAEAAVSVTDGGFVQGTAVAEQLRTFGGKLFRLEAHVDRLLRSLAIVEVDAGLSRDELIRIARELVQRNHPLLAEGDDLGLAIFVTPGEYVPMRGKGAGRPTVGLHTFPLRFELWADHYKLGQSLVTSDVAQVAEACWPRELKCRSRMHYYLADLRARRRDPGSRALMLDADGCVAETTTANIVLQTIEGLITPPREKILPGISLAVLFELAERLGVQHCQRNLTAADVAAADEVYLTSTSSCIIPVVRFDGRPIGAGVPGPMYARFLAAWGEMVGVDIAEQARRFAIR